MAEKLDGLGNQSKNYCKRLSKKWHYDYNKIKTLFPIVEYINPIDLTKLIWGVQPEYKNKLLKNIDIDFDREKDSNGFYNVTNAMYYNKDTNHGFKINITSETKIIVILI